MNSTVICTLGPDGDTETMLIERSVLVKNAVFKAMLTDDWLEGQEREVRIPDILPAAFDLFVDHLEGFKLPEHMTPENAVEFLKVGKKYLENDVVQRARLLIQRLAHFLPEKAFWMYAKIREALGQDESNLLGVLYGAVLFDPERALEMEKEDFLVMVSSDLLVLTGHEFLGKCTEKTIVRAMIGWAKAHLEEEEEDTTNEAIREKLGEVLYNIRPLRMNNTTFMTMVGNYCTPAERGSVNDFRHRFGNGGPFNYNNRLPPRMFGFHVNAEVGCGATKGLSTTDSVIFVIREDLVPVTGEMTRRILQSDILHAINLDGWEVLHDRGTFFMELIVVRDGESFELEEDFLVPGADQAEEFSPITWGPGVLALKVMPKEYADGKKYRYLLSIGVDYKCDAVEGSVPVGLVRGNPENIFAVIKSMLAKGGKNINPPMRTFLRFENM